MSSPDRFQRALARKRSTQKREPRAIAPELFLLMRVVCRATGTNPTCLSHQMEPTRRKPRRVVMTLLERAECTRALVKHSKASIRRTRADIACTKAEINLVRVEIDRARTKMGGIDLDVASAEEADADAHRSRPAQRVNGNSSCPASTKPNSELPAADSGPGGRAFQSMAWPAWIDDKEPEREWRAMIYVKNPSKEEIQDLINASEDRTAKWIRDSANGDLYLWPAEACLHADVARALRCRDYTQGITSGDEQKVASGMAMLLAKAAP